MTEVTGTAFPGPVVGADSVRFFVPDAGRLAGVHLRLDNPLPAQDFVRCPDGWELVIGRPPVQRLEYLLELRTAGGGPEIRTDPANPVRAPGAFGDKSVIEFPGYAPPAWLSASGQPGHSMQLEVPAKWLDRPVPVRIWAPDGTPDDDPLPLLIAHDGPEYDSLASLTQYLAAGLAGGWLPRLRAALLGPGWRDRWYSANPGYAHALCEAVLPALTERLATTIRIAMGTSLGGLAMLHAHCQYPDAFDALFLQSGSFFCADTDSQERRFPYFRRIVRFIADVHLGGLPKRSVPVALTCGAIEENVSNNRRMASALHAAGYPVSLAELPDLHNYTAWRDGFDPHLTKLLAGSSR